jgi:thymidine phosphorylase
MRFVMNSVLDKIIADHQLAGFAMAFYFQGIKPQEIATFTEEIMLIGEVFELPRMTKPTLDRYAMGGVGDKASLVLIPSAARGVSSWAHHDEPFSGRNQFGIGAGIFRLVVRFATQPTHTR